jgi:hypothetical protein
MLGLAISATGGDGYKKYRQSLKDTPGIIRLYTFEEGKGDEVTNWVELAPGKLALTGGPLGSLTVLRNSPYGLHRNNYHNTPAKPGEFSPKWTSGRFAGKAGLTGGRTLRGLFRSGIDGSQFAKGGTISGYIRPHRADGSAQVLVLGNAYDAGFALSFDYAGTNGSGTVSMRLGNTAKKPVTVYAKTLPAGAWTRFDVTVDGKTLKLYLNGKLAAEKPSATITPVKQNKYDPFDEGHGHCAHYFMRLGTQRASCGFDVDELAIFERALTAAEIAKLSQAGASMESVVAQQAAFKIQMERQAKLDQVAMTIPTDTLGYFKAGQPIPATFDIPASTGFSGTYTAEAVLYDLNNHPVQTLLKPLAAGRSLTLNLTPPRHDVYTLDLILRDQAGETVKQLPERYTIGITVPTPKTLANNPLGNQAVREKEHYNMGFKRQYYYYGSYKNPDSHARWMAELAEYEQNIPGMRLYCCIQIPWPKKVGPAEREDMAAYFTFVARALKDHIWMWELSNEPNGKISPENYFEILKVFTRVMRQETPGIPLNAPGASPSGVPFIQRLFELGMEPLIDVLTFHDYIGAPIQARRWLDNAAKFKAMLEKFDPAGRIVIANSESGYFSLPRINYRPLRWDEALKMGAYRVVTYRGVKFLVTSMPTMTETLAAARQVQDILISLASGYQFYNKCQSSGLVGRDAQPSSSLPNRQALALRMLGGKILDNPRSIREMPLSEIDNVCLLIDNGGKKIAAIFSQHPAVLTFRVKPNTTYRTLDMLGNAADLQSSASGLLTVSASEEPLYLFDCPAGFAEVAPLHLTMPAQLPEKGVMTGTLTVYNPFDRSLQGTLSARTIPGAQVELGRSQVKLAANGKTSIPVTLTATALKRRDYALGIELKHSGKLLAAAEAVFHSSGVVHKVYRSKKPILLDGNVDDWKTIPATTCTGEENVVAGKPNLAELWLPQWRGDDDLSFSLKTAWRRKEGIYFLLSVRDQTGFPAPADKTGLAFRYDCLELFFDSRDPKSQGSPISFGADQAIVIPQMGSKAAPCKLWFAKKNQEWISLDCVGRKTADGYLLEGRIVPNQSSNMRILPGTQFHMDVMIDDTDKASELRSSIMALHGEADNNTNSSRWGRYELSLEKK